MPFSFGLTWKPNFTERDFFFPRVILLGWRFRCCGLLSEAINLDYLEAETRHLLYVTKKNISIFRSFCGIESPRFPNMVLAKQSDYKIRSRKKIPVTDNIKSHVK